jgi:hypothetical protein
MSLDINSFNLYDRPREDILLFYSFGVKTCIVYIFRIQSNLYGIKDGNIHNQFF